MLGSIMGNTRRAYCLERTAWSMEQPVCTAGRVSLVMAGQTKRTASSYRTNITKRRSMMCCLEL